MLSRQGPKLAIGDVNNDGKNDVFFGSSVGDTSKLFIQTATGFVPSLQKVFDKDKDKEAAGAVFFDIDNDKDMDLLVASGGYQYDQGSSLLNVRLYINDGKGNFTPGQMPDIATNASCVKAIDYDKDGFTDVFIGGRAVTGNYGKPGRSYLLHNENGKLVDRTPESLKEPGMVTDACWSDINKDGYPDLMLVGDWMPVTFFLNNKGLLDKKQTVPNSAGLWNCITPADVDKDRVTDFLLGNWGLNSRFKASPEKPMELFVNDFDKNGTSEAILTYYWPDGKSHLFNSKFDITAQLPFLRKKFLLYKDYAGKSINEVLDPEKVNQSKKLQIQTLASSLLKFKGDKWTLEPLPEMAQISPIFCIVADDFNKDGNMDIFTGGNYFDIKPDIGRLDANAASVFFGNGKGKFEYASKYTTGLNVQGQVRDAGVIIHNGKKLLFLSRNNDAVICLEQN